MKIYINRKPIEGPWGGGNNFVKAMYEYLPDFGFEIIDRSDLHKHINDIDFIFLQSPFPDQVSKFSINEAISVKNINPKVKIILRVNDCDARKGTNDVDNIWIESSKFVDKTIFVSNWMKEYFLEKGWKCRENFVVINGVNLDHFKPREKINNGKINIVTHHWSNNRMKGFDLYEEIDRIVEKDERFTFTYIGRDLGTFRNTRIVSPLFGEELGVELSKYDVYISDSKFDPGPNHILESLACKIPTYVCKDGGGSVEFAGLDFTFANLEDLLQAILCKNKIKNNSFVVYNWKKCIEKLSKIF